jgi:hypothetical protein
VGDSPSPIFFGKSVVPVDPCRPHRLTASFVLNAVFHYNFPHRHVNGIAANHPAHGPNTPSDPATDKHQRRQSKRDATTFEVPEVMIPTLGRFRALGGFSWINSLSINDLNGKAFTTSGGADDGDSLDR